MKKHFQSEEPDQDFYHLDLSTVLGVILTLFIIYIIVVGYSLIA